MWGAAIGASKVDSVLGAWGVAADNTGIAVCQAVW